MKRLIFAGLGLSLAAVPAAAQDSELAATCNGVPQQARETCLTVAQAAESAQPQLGILIAGGNPVLGTASTGGVRLGLVPRVSAGLRLNVVFARVPDIIVDQSGAAQTVNETLGIPAPALGGNVSLGLFPGLSLAPTLGGFGAVDLLGSATWLPFKTLGVEGFDEDTPEFAFGGGVRVGLLRESFVTPGVSVSAMYRRLGRVRFGDVCPGGESPTAPPGGTCLSEGDVGEFEFDLTNWSYRAAVSKRFLGLGLTAGLGYDRFESDVRYAVRYQDPLAPAVTRVFRSPQVAVDNGR
ncbi:MAG TPA: hypothetical protein VEW03_12380, partial [Longimicrobiaceae bacterium]|nr:hypothetical protein [Longimicrobiaceae bacterium]